MKNISIIINGLLILSVLLFVFDGLTAFEIKSQPIKTFTYYGIFVFAPLVLIWNLIIIKRKKKKIIAVVLPILTLIGIFIIGPNKILFSSSAWKTQTVIYENSNSNSKRIELQMQDIGALGYNKRKVEVTYLSNLFMIVKSAENEMTDKADWIQVNRDVNELGLKTP